MPMYEFICDKCGQEFEELAFGDATVPCPHCGAKDTRRLISACARCRRGNSEAGFTPTSSGGGCASCSGGNCASCGH